MLPAVDVANMEHLAWTFDALFYLLQVSVCTLSIFFYDHLLLAATCRLCLQICALVQCKAIIVNMDKFVPTTISA